MEHTASEQTYGRKAARDGLQLPVVVLSAVVLLALVATLATRLAGFTPDSTPRAEIVAQRELGFRDLPGGAIEIYDRADARVLQRVQAGEGSFLRGVVRSLVRQRRGLEVAEAGFLLTRYGDGRVLLADPQTGEFIDLIAFGPTNLAAFTPLLTAQGTTEVERPADALLP